MNNEQRTEKWLLARKGKVTSSQVYKVLVKGQTPNGIGAEAYTYMNQLIVDSYIKEPRGRFKGSKATDWGTEQEQNALMEYEARTDVEIFDSGFVEYAGKNKTLKGFVGGSPDGLIKNKKGIIEGIVEVKCPYNTENHINTIITQGENIESKYILQMQMNMWLTGAKWCDYVSYDVELDNPYNLFIKRLDKNETTCSLIEMKSTVFIEELKNRLKILKNYKKI